MSQSECQNNSGFIFGLILGAFIASAIIILNSKDKDKIIKNIKDKISKLFEENITSSKKISVEIPQNLISAPVTAIKKPVKLFKKK